MSENKTSRYFKYAIGEIILVVIGILIALQINNWNEGRKERQIETEILKELKENLNQDIINLNLKVKETDYFKLCNKKVLEHLENRTPLTDSLKGYYALIQASGTFRPITAGYENLKSKGVDIIQNKTLRNSITKLYDYQYFYFVEDLEYAILNFRSDKASYLSDKIFLDENNDIFAGGQPINLERLYNDEVLKGYLKSTIVFLNWMNIKRNDGIQQIKGVIKVIEKELNND